MTDKSEILEKIREYGKRRSLLDDTIKQLETELVMEDIDVCLDLFECRDYAKLLTFKIALPFLKRAFPSKQITFKWDTTFNPPRYSIWLETHRANFNESSTLSKQTMSHVMMMEPHLMKISISTGRFVYDWLKHQINPNKPWNRLSCEFPGMLRGTVKLDPMEGTIDDVFNEIVMLVDAFPYQKIGGPE